MGQLLALGSAKRPSDHRWPTAPVFPGENTNTGGVLSDDSSRKCPSVAVGLNSNVRASSGVAHVQTEDLGRARAAIVTHVFSSTGQVIRVVRFDYGKHVDHPGLSRILPRAMQAQHAAAIRQLHEEAGDVWDIPADMTPPPRLVIDPDPYTSYEISTPGPECIHQRMEPVWWDRLLAWAQRTLGIESPTEATPNSPAGEPHQASEDGESPSKEPSKKHS